MDVGPSRPPGTVSATTSDLIVIGAGVVGSSVAWHATQRGARVTVLDIGDGPGYGSTSRATGGYRGQFSTAINVKLSLLAREKLRRFPEEVGADPEMRTVGYFFLCDTEAQLATFREMRAMQHSCGLTEATEVGPDDFLDINPHVSYDGVIGASWCPTDATIRPMEILRGYLNGALARGAAVHWGTTVTGFERSADGRITSVSTTNGTFSAPHIVNAAGPWAGHVARLAGVPLPVSPLRRQIGVAVGHGLPDSFPMTIWVRDAFHLRIRDGQALLNRPTDTPGTHEFDYTLYQPWIDDVWAIAQERVPSMRAARLDPSAHWVGFYEMSPDKTIIIGTDPTVPNFIFANGSSGHGVMHSPITGQLVTELALDGAATTLDIHSLRPTRFAEGDAHPVNDLL
jgi:sarcosine oxidase subunit beta